ncbi:CAF17-like 4Fe-4S cluster assembly/insertion protein YgfZ [Phenylobacterium montanum]|uniref:Folate-binding protein YgfZ n=1 Tax=Phenylobacterium montanum TaxID=2823693 RepID=A0A975FYA4_9CAUL|nr:folate-binding protein YgfZ [Caulobacter sp. S6]QUD87157.1 folate-binding protein YgfZ [Caulobacter sp. S6]
MTLPPLIAPLASRALIAVTGPDWKSFLQGLITQDAETLKPGELRFGALLTPQGKLLFDLFLFGLDDGCLVDVAADRREALIQRLTIYRLRAKVEITAREGTVLAAWQAPVPHGPGWAEDPRLHLMGARGYGAEPPHGAIMTDEAAYHAHRLALGVPDPDADCPPETTYPIEADFDLLNGVDFKKGCFVGQETTSRMKRRGAIKNRMLAIRFDGPPPAPGAEVLAGSLRAGQVLSGRDGAAMALLRLDRIEGADLTVDGRPVSVLRPGWLAEG